MLGLLRRLFGGRADEPKAGTRDTRTPWYMRSKEEEVTPERIEAARQRLKETIPPPEGEGT